jgi:hypothetical protein
VKQGSALKASATLLATAVATVPLGVLAVDAWVGREFAVSALLGACLAAALAISSLVLAAWSYDKPQVVFLSALAGGFLGRMFAFSAGLALLVTITRLPVTAFVAGLFSYYVLFQVLEVRALQKLIGRRSALPH